MVLCNHTEKSNLYFWSAENKYIFLLLIFFIPLLFTVKVELIITKPFDPLSIPRSRHALDLSDGSYSSVVAVPVCPLQQVSVVYPTKLSTYI